MYSARVAVTEPDRLEHHSTRSSLHWATELAEKDLAARGLTVLAGSRSLERGEAASKNVD
jgi:hypothetical protein